MLPEPPLLRECPHCHRAVLFPNFSRGSLRGASVWTDGRMVGPWIPDDLRLAGCPCCGEPFWVNEGIELGVATDATAQAKYPEAPMPKELDAPAILDALEKGLARSPRQERYLRIHAWWRDGDGRREGVARELSGEAPDERQLSNMRRLHGMLDEEVPDDRLMKAELSRQLGRFDEALHLLRHDFDGEDHAAAAARIRELAEAKDVNVARVEFSFNVIEEGWNQPS